MDMVFGTSSTIRTDGNFPELPVINMVADSVPSEDGVSLISRPGLKSVSSVTTTPITKVFKEDGILGGSTFSTSGTTLYRDGSHIGDITGDGPVSITGFSNTLFINAGSEVFSYDGTTLSQVAIPDGNPIIRLCVGASRMIALRADSQMFYWTDLLSTNVDALSFASAENTPDNLADCLFTGNTLILFGTESVEFWPVSTDADLPYQPLIGRVFSVGVKNTGAATSIYSTFAWVTNRNKVCIGDQSTVVSYPGLEKKIEDESSVSLWTFNLHGSDYLVLQLSEETWVYNLDSKTWSEFNSYGLTNWLAQGYSNGVFAGQTGDILEWSDDYYDLTNLFERRFRAWAPLTSEKMVVNAVKLRLNKGFTAFPSSPYDSPVIEMRSSKDAGATWKSWKPRSLGKEGQHYPVVNWQGCGLFFYPGIMLEFRVSDPVPFRISKVVINE